METDELKSHLQSFFTDGLVTVIGLGHSAAHGLPTMPVLAEGLGERVPAMIDDSQAEDWEKVRAALDEGRHLEDALVSIDHESRLIEVIVEASAEIIGAAEATAIRELIHDGARFPLAELVPHLAPNDRATVVATNYDRLAEVAIESAGYFLDCGFVGMHRGRADAMLSRTSLRSNAVPRKKGFSFRYQPHVRLAKPHGSLDWYLCDGVPIRCPFALELPRLMITPGASKFRKGYERPFDHHREIANHAIDAATRFLAIGFGFNDPHLQTHLTERIEAGAPCLILVKELTEAAKELLARGAGVIALESLPATGTRVHRGRKTEDLANQELWKLETFIDEVLK
ncbi:MAG TPA: SIR2 family protein [Solirubrobacterales bacterium]|nr:SIR2 family protein [Solirubrobacterales bacterium]